MDEQKLTVKNKNEIYLRPTYSHKIDPNKIKTLDDVIQILKRVILHVDDEGVKGIEHLIERREVEDYKITAGVIKGEQL
ncbi:hypothetical protein [Bacillus thuringiensis]|uniref:Uncharacterized protein n=1 Tax=Bacillus thuringiensis subsp. higo TaxID=132266 RepID=A0A9X6LZE5_BACUH|nr:hypothetical protein [Bacillus thuringiensis]OUB61240.1 hypothetical protein BK716_01675 [Bacillus thuringiensis serovar higo]